MARIAILGGSFNPPHVGHLLAAHYVRAVEPVDEVWLVPSYVHPFGKQLTSFEHRRRMCELLCEDTSGWMKVSEVEKDLGERGGEGRTVETLEHLHRTRPGDELILVIGSDIVKDLPMWKDFGRIQQLARVLVLNRAGYPHPGAIGPPLAEVSSTEVRERMAEGKGAEGLVPWRVLEYAEQHGLYPAGAPTHP